MPYWSRLFIFFQPQYLLYPLEKSRNNGLLRKFLSKEILSEMLSTDVELIFNVKKILLRTYDENI